MFKSFLKKGGKRAGKGSRRAATGGAGLFASSLKKNSRGLKNRFKKSGSALADRAKKNSDLIAKKAKKGGGDLARKAKKSGGDVAGKLKNKTKDVADLAARKSKTALKMAGEKCYKEPKKCAAVAAGVALAGYTAYKFAENSKEQQICITNCLPESWAQYQYGNVSEVSYFEEDMTEDENGNPQPQCTSGDCETFCEAECKKLHPTTVIGAAKEALTDVMDKALVPFLEDFIGLPITSMSSKMFMFFRIVLGLIVLMVAYRIYSAVKAIFGITRAAVNTVQSRCEAKFVM